MPICARWRPAYSAISSDSRCTSSQPAMALSAALSSAWIVPSRSCMAAMRAVDVSNNLETAWMDLRTAGLPASRSNSWRCDKTIAWAAATRSRCCATGLGCLCLRSAWTLATAPSAPLRRSAMALASGAPIGSRALRAARANPRSLARAWDARRTSSASRKANRFSAKPQGRRGPLAVSVPVLGHQTALERATRAIRLSNNTTTPGLRPCVSASSGRGRPRHRP
jgi:hypothetical protein